MSKQAICSITTESHWYKTLALAESIHKISPSTIFCILTVNGAKENLKNIEYEYGKIEVYELSDIILSQTAKNIAQKYQAKFDYLRWSLKSIFLLHLLEVKQYEQIFYCDNDIFFYKNFSFLMDELKQHAVLITPHYYDFDPEKGQFWLEGNFRSGLYNAGFVGVNQNAKKILHWWAKCCLYRCQKNYKKGLYVDQKFLDLFPIIEPSTKIVRQKGCNVAYWNFLQNERVLVDNEVLIEGIDPVIFIHYVPHTFQGILSGEDYLLEPHLQKYCEVLKKYKPDFSPNNEFSKIDYKGIFGYFKWRLEFLLYRLPYRKWYKQKFEDKDKIVRRKEK